MKTSNNTDHVSGPDKPWLLPWDSNELEAVASCPVCNSKDRLPFLEGLVDNVFFVAPGRWTLHECKRCQSVYLDPRPNEASIGKAYGTYYTHSGLSEQRVASSDLSLPRRLARTLGNGYLNRRYGTQRQPANRFGNILIRLFPSKRQILDVEFRYLPKPSPGQRLLDIGCGNGSFLASAEEAGWEALGLDSDVVAVENAKKNRLNVKQGSVDLLKDFSRDFDVVTLSHVVEHLHDPKSVLEQINKILKNDGVLYIETPNIQSNGFALFGKNWRGIETPRHLVIFSQKALVDLLKACGFRDLKLIRRTIVRKNMHLSGLRLAMGKSPYADEPQKLPASMWLKLRLWPVPAQHDEFLTILARK